ncbi:ABC transporter permease [Nocardioides sp. WS12]|uniref:ABC transporter permease n=1 Tax=Nocardioides sp. WS12 TaxID=2486272 RepID=UPI0015F8A909|nr:ABC transporter permease [Nocardioides sp. WS12]
MSQNLSTSGGWRVALRLARREALRRKGQTALMLVLICLPVLAVSAAAIVWRTADVSGVEGIDRRIGSAEALIETSWSDNIVQSPDPEAGGYGNAENEIDEDAVLDGTDLAAVRKAVGPDRPITVFGHDSIGFQTDKGIGDFEAFTTDLANPVTDGLFEPVSGEYPPGPGEVVVNQALADRGPGVGDTLTAVRKSLDGTEQKFELKVVGIAESAGSRGYPLAAALPGAFGTGDSTMGRWLVGGGPVTWDDVKELNRIGLLITSRAVLTDPPEFTDYDGIPAGDGVDDITMTVLALVAAMVLLEVVLLAGPAFAVRAKAQAHTLALVAAAGGTPRQARRTVLASGVVIGSIGGVLGVVLGVLVGAAAVPIAQRFDTSRFGPFEIPWLLLVVVAAFGLVSALLAAVVPAFSASRHDVVAVLAGRRGEGSPSARSPILGLVLLGGGIVSAVLGSGGGRDTAPLLIAGSAIVSVFGMILLVPMVVVLMARLSARWPLALRFAARDAARHRTRTVPAVAAVGATVAGVVALGIAVSSQEASNEAGYMPQLPVGQASIAFPHDMDRASVDETLARYLPGQSAEQVQGLQSSTDTGELEIEFSAAGEAMMLEYWSSIGSPYLVGTEVPDYIEMDADDRERADAVLADGGLVLLRGSDDDGRDASEVRVDVRRYVPTEELPQDLASATAKAGVVHVAQRTPPAPALMSPEVVKELGLEVDTVGVILPGPISESVEKDIQEVLGALPIQPYLYVERGYQADSAVRIIQFVLGALGGILMLGGTLTATFLALSDARPDLATMAAVGARPRERRRVAAGYALFVGGIGALLGAPVGFIPGLAISQPLTRDFDTGLSSMNVPWLLIGLVVVGLPLLTAAAVGACARGRLPLTARVE